MKLTRLLKCSELTIIVGIFIVCSFTNVHGKNVKNATTKLSFGVLQQIQQFCKQKFHKKTKKDKSLDNQAICQLRQNEADTCFPSSILQSQVKSSFDDAFIKQSMIQLLDSIDNKTRGIILGAYETINGLYANPIDQVGMYSKSFKITSDTSSGQSIDLAVDGNPYINFLVYGVSNHMWHRVSLISYLQQTSTQINSDSPTIATKKSLLPSHNILLNDVAKDELLEELLGVHTFAQPAKSVQGKNIWTKLLFDFSIGSGVVFYNNQLVQMRLLHRKQHDYFFITKANEVYKPNWFHYTLNKEIGFHQPDCIDHSSAEDVVFQGKGLGLPITLGIQYLFWKKMFLGIGREMIFNFTSRLVHNSRYIQHKEYIIRKKWSAQGRWFAKCGWYAFSNEKYRFFADIRLFLVYHLGNMFSRLVVFGPYVYRALAYNWGLGYEQQLTDYFSCTARLSVELQKFKQFPCKQSYDYNIHYKHPAIYLQVGLAMQCAKSSPYRYVQGGEYPNKERELDEVIQLEGLQDLLGLD